MNFYDKIEHITKTKPMPADLSEMIQEYEAVREAIEESEEEQKAHAKFSEEYNNVEQEISDMEDELEKIEARINMYVDKWGQMSSTQVASHGASASAPEKKSGGVGWLLFGGVVLVLTFGAVNAFKK